MGFNPYILSFSDLHRVDEDLIGKKAEILGELKSLGISIPDGFVIMPSFFQEFLEQKSLADNLIQELHKNYRKLSGELRHTPLVIYSSTQSGKSKTFKNVKGDANLVIKIKEMLPIYLNEPFALVVQKDMNSSIDGRIITNDNALDKKFINLAQKIQKHFYFPQEIDYAVERGKVYVINIKQFTGTPIQSPKVITQNKKNQKALIKGISINPGIVSGSVRVLLHKDSRKIKSDEIIVLSDLNKSMYKKIQEARAVIFDSTLFNDYDKMVYRKLFKIPTIYNAKNATKILQNGNIVTVNGMTGEIYSGGLM